jgi:dihydrofolate synthase/folylpolyglutamate synthase
VFGPQDSSLREVIIDYLLLRRSKGLFYGEDWDIQKKGTELIVYEDKYDKLEINSIGLNGDHQIINAGICIASLKFLQREGKIQIDDEKIRRGIKVVSWPGRLSKLSGKTNDLLMDSCEIWVDGCHNPAGSKVISKAISDMNISNKKETILILGLSEHKNINKFIMNFRDISREIIVVPLRGRKSINFIEIKNPAEAMDYSIARKSNINDALKTLKKRENIRVLICGSFSLVSEALLGD